MNEQTQASSMTVPEFRPQADDRMPLSDLFGILRRRRWFILFGILVLTALPATYGLLLEPKYTAMASVVIEPQQSHIINLQEVVPKPSPDVAAVGAQADIIRSRELLLQTITDLNLLQDPEFQEASSGVDQVAAMIRDAPSGLVSSLAQWLEGWSGRVVAATRDENTLPVPSDGVDPREAVISMFASQLEISQPGDSYVLRVSFTSVDPTKAARIVNRLIENYLVKELDEKIRATQNANSWLSGRLQTMQQEVLDAEHRVAEFESTNRLAIRTGGSLTDAQLADLTRKLNEVRAAKAEQEAKLQAANARGSDTILDVLTSPVISGLRIQDAALVRRDAELATDYGERHPMRVAAREESAKLKQRIDKEVDRIVQGIWSNISVLAAQERMLEQQLAEMTSQSGRDNQAAVRLGELEREATAKRTLYAALLGRYQETSSQDGILQPDARAVSQADVPSVPSTPSPLIFGAVGFTAATVFSCMLALLREQLDTKLRSGRQVERELRVKCLGLMPKAVGLPRGGAVCRQLHSKPRSAFTQAVRALYTQLAITGKLPPHVILVTSALPEEGKTSLATSLAVCAAQGGIRHTLLVDFDMWRPGVARDLRLTPHLGVAEVLDSGNKVSLLETAILNDPSLGIDILPAAQFGNDQTRLAAQSIGELIAKLRIRYEYIVIDSPPLLGMNDARIISRFADVTVFAIRWQHTRRDAAAAGLRVLQDASANVAGAVLTRVDLKKHARDGQGDGLEYYSKFQKYYAE